MKIVGSSGVSILLAGQVMLRYDPEICISDETLINNHTAVLRFKTDEIGKFLNVPFKKVVIDKLIKLDGEVYSKSDLRLQNMYSQKVTGNILDRSIRDISSEVRYIAPSNLFDYMKVGLNIRTRCDEIKELEFDREDKSRPILSYVSMIKIRKHLGLPELNFEFNPVYTVNCKILDPNIEVYQTIYYPGNEKYYRVSITKNNVIIEYIRRPLVDEIQEDIFKILKNDFWISNFNLGEIHYNVLPMGKINPIDEEVRKDFIYQLTDKYGIYSFGRKGILKSIKLEDLFKDLYRIDSMIRSNKYSRRLNMTY